MWGFYRDSFTFSYLPSVRLCVHVGVLYRGHISEPPSEYLGKDVSVFGGPIREHVSSRDKAATRLSPKQVEQLIVLTTTKPTNRVVEALAN